MASGAAASVKLCATGLQRPRVLTVKIELTSARGTFGTCRRTLRMSANRVLAQRIDATQALNLSAGVSNCKVSRGRSFGLIGPPRTACRSF